MAATRGPANISGPLPQRDDGVNTTTNILIDRSFVGGLGIDAGDETIVSAVMGLVRAMKLEVVAEGVKTRGQLDRLRELQCQRGQGACTHRSLYTGVHSRWRKTGHSRCCLKRIRNGSVVWGSELSVKTSLVEAFADARIPHLPAASPYPSCGLLAGSDPPPSTA